MKILAVIPARAGSKGIPNKNIRIVNGHPLIYYSINNAINSKYITDIIVTTDSYDVKIIAKQMGVNVRWRDERLCADDVTLDAVIYDAIPKDAIFDYVVTIQPTSPTLKTDTLDSAIKYAIEEKTDTLISAINAPHLSWGEKDGKKVPNYKERLNRQFLPPCYMETGAFVISRRDVVTKDTRIGKNVDVFEVSEDESFDIDTFENLRTVDAILGKKKVAIYVNGNNTRGTGHIYRALEIADEFYVKPDIYYDKNQTDVGIFGTTTHNLLPVDGIVDLYKICKSKQYDIFINDILSTSIDYMIGLRSVLPEAKIVNFEDDGEGAESADIVFNALFDKTAQSNERVGEDYYIAGKSFLFYRPIEIKDEVKNVLITFGGSDPMNYTERLLQIVSQPEFSNYHFIVVLGRAKQNVDEILKYNSYENIEVFHDIKDMPEIMSECDIAVTSRGRTCYELAMLGIPTISMAQNRREEKHGFVCQENGFDYIGLDPGVEMIKGNLKIYLEMSKEDRQGFQDKLLSHDLKSGRKRIMDLINSL